MLHRFQEVRRRVAFLIKGYYDYHPFTTRILFFLAEHEAFSAINVDGFLGKKFIAAPIRVSLGFARLKLEFISKFRIFRIA